MLNHRPPKCQLSARSVHSARRGILRIRTLVTLFAFGLLAALLAFKRLVDFSFGAGFLALVLFLVASSAIAHIHLVKMQGHCAFGVTFAALCLAATRRVRCVLTMRTDM